jgi:hypothetical protein
MERQEIERVGKSLAAEKHAPFRMKDEGDRVSGVYTGTTNLVSGKYAVIENSYEFTLVPWRPVMDERLGRQISGVVRDSSVSWDFGRKAWARNRDVSAQSRPLRFLIWLKSSPMLGYM